MIGRVVRGPVVLFLARELWLCNEVIFGDTKDSGDLARFGLRIA